MARTSMAPKSSVSHGGKEELRASILKTYLLRLRAEKGEEAVEAVLDAASIDASLIDNERGWVSSTAARRALRAIARALGVDALRSRGEWITHPEALGTYVRMLRSAEHPIDAYRYLAENAGEVTRLGTLAAEDVLPEGTPKAKIDRVRVVYRHRTDGLDEAEKPTTESEGLHCAARTGELTALPRIWGLGDAVVTHEKCLAKGDDCCSYLVVWQPGAQRLGAAAGAAAGVVGAGGLLLATGGPLAGAVGALVGGGLAAAVGALWDRSKTMQSARVFEKNRIAALERGLELRGEAQQTAQPGELTDTVLGGKYRIGRKIGSGGIGVVYAAKHTTLGHEVAVKVLRGAAARDGGEIARLRREAYIQVHVDHPNVARVLDLDQMPDGSMYVVMEKLKGRSLADKLAREGVIAPAVAVPLFLGVARALGAAHAKDVVHRDLKPGNVFLCDDGNAKVLDFGMSKLTSAESLTQAGYTLGTPEYMAPEQCIGANVVPQTDLYALGVLMYEALTGELPISSRNRRELLDLHQRKVPKSMRERRPDLEIPEELDAIVMTCLKKKIGERPASASAVEEMLAAIDVSKLVATATPKPDSARERDDGTLPLMASDPPPKP